MRFFRVATHFQKTVAQYNELQGQTLDVHFKMKGDCENLSSQVVPFAVSLNDYTTDYTLHW